MSQSNDALLRRFEPVLRFTHGEQFFPLDAEHYLAACSLWVRRPNEPPEQVVAREALTARLLAQPRADHVGSVAYLSFVDPVGPAAVRAFWRSSTLREFQAGRGRLARVGLLARILDLVFSIALLLRGRVPGGLAVAAAQRYQQLAQAASGYCYYGRVTRQHGYTVLQYWYFYAFNDWRSSFYGVNDHESDWEQVSLFLAADDDGELRPRWLAYSSHLFGGDDLRRRWDDPEVEWVGEHPVVYVAAGSHANYYAAGEYLPVAEVPYTAPLVRAWLQARATWNKLLRQASEEITPQEITIFRIPFVDYARGDGLCIGPGQQLPLELRPLDPPPAWLDGYHGLWGLFTRDPIAGEDAPAGPMFSRDGTPARVWHDPVGWAGLDKVPPPSERLAVLRSQRAARAEERRQVDEQAAQQAAALMRLQVEAEALANMPHLRWQLLARRKELKTASLALRVLKQRSADLWQLLQALDGYEAWLLAGEELPPRSHIRVPQLPATPAELRLSRLAETWSALSSGLLLLAFVALFTFRQGWQIGLLALVGVYALIEALFRRQAQQLLRNSVVGLAAICTLVLLYEFHREVIVGAVLAIGLLIIVENIRELRD